MSATTEGLVSEINPGKKVETKYRSERENQNKTDIKTVLESLTESVKNQLSSEIDPILNNPTALIQYFKNQFPIVGISDYSPSWPKNFKFKQILCNERYTKAFLELILNNETYFRTIMSHPEELEYFCQNYPEYAPYLRQHFDVDIILRISLGIESKPKSEFLPPEYRPQWEEQMKNDAGALFNKKCPTYEDSSFSNNTFFEAFLNDDEFAADYIVNHFVKITINNYDWRTGKSDESYNVEFTKHKECFEPYADRLFSRLISMPLLFADAKRFECFCSIDAFKQKLMDLEKSLFETNNSELALRFFGHQNGVKNFTTYCKLFDNRPDFKEKLALLLLSNPAVLMPMLLREEDCKAFCEALGNDSKIADEARRIRSEARKTLKEVSKRLPKLPISLDADNTVFAQHTGGCFKHLNIDKILEKLIQGTEKEEDGLDIKLAIEEFEVLEKLFADWAHLEPFMNSQGANKTRLKNALRAITRKRAVQYTDLEISMRCFGLETDDLLNLHCNPEKAESLRKRKFPQLNDIDSISDIKEISEKLKLDFLTVYQVLIQGCLDRIAESEDWTGVGLAKMPAIFFRLIALTQSNDTRTQVPFIACDDSSLELGAIDQKLNLLIKHCNAFNTLPKMPQVTSTTIRALSGNGPGTKNELGHSICGSKFADKLVEQVEAYTLDIIAEALPQLSKEDKLLLEPYIPFFEQRSKILPTINKIHYKPRKIAEAPNEESHVAKLLNLKPLSVEELEKLKAEWLEKSGRTKEEIELVFASFAKINPWAPIFSNTDEYPTARLQSRRDDLLSKILHDKHVWSNEHDEVLAIDRELMRRKPKISTNLDGDGCGDMWNRFPFPNQMLAVLVTAKLPLYGYNGSIETIPEYLIAPIDDHDHSGNQKTTPQPKHIIFNAIDTGDGKSMILHLGNGFIASTRNKRWVMMSPTTYLAKREKRNFAPYFKLLGMSCQYDGTTTQDILPDPIFKSTRIIITTPMQFVNRKLSGLAKDLQYGSIDEGHIIAYEKFGDRVAKYHLGETLHGAPIYRELLQRITHYPPAGYVHDRIIGNPNLVSEENIIKTIESMGFRIARTEAEERESMTSPDRDLYFPIKGEQFQAFLKACKVLPTVKLNEHFQQVMVNNKADHKFIGLEFSEAQKYPDHLFMYTKLLLQRTNCAEGENNTLKQLEIGSIPYQTALRDLVFSVMVSGTPGRKEQQQALSKRGVVFTRVPNNFPRKLDERPVSLYKYKGAWNIAPIQSAVVASQKLNVLYLCDNFQRADDMRYYFERILGLNNVCHFDLLTMPIHEINHMLSLAELKGTIFISSTPVPVGLDIPCSLQVITDVLPDSDNGLQQSKGRTLRFGRPDGGFEQHYSVQNLSARIGLAKLPDAEKLSEAEIHSMTIEAQRALEMQRIPLNEDNLLFMEEQNLADAFYNTIPDELRDDELASKFDLSDYHTLVSAEREWGQAYQHLSLKLGAYQQYIAKRLSQTEGTRIGIAREEIESMRTDFGKYVAKCIYDYWTTVRVDRYLGRPSLTPEQWVEENRASFKVGIADRLIKLLSAYAKANYVKANVSLETKERSEATLTLQMQENNAHLETKANVEANSLLEVQNLLKECLATSDKLTKAVSTVETKERDEKELTLKEKQMAIRMVRQYQEISRLISQINVTKLNPDQKRSLLLIHMDLYQICVRCNAPQIAPIANLCGFSREDAISRNAEFTKTSLYEDVLPQLVKNPHGRIEVDQYILGYFASSIYDEAMDELAVERLQFFLRDIRENMDTVLQYPQDKLTSLLKTMEYLDIHMNADKFNNKFRGDDKRYYPFRKEMVQWIRKELGEFKTLISSALTKATSQAEQLARVALELVQIDTDMNAKVDNAQAQNTVVHLVAAGLTNTGNASNVSFETYNVSQLTNVEHPDKPEQDPTKAKL